MDSFALQRRLTCILAADAVGYSKHMGQDEEGTIQVLSAHRAVIDGIIAFHRGRIVGTAGDSVLAEFTSAVEAVRCAVEIQDALRTRNDALPEHRRLLFRVGVNLGDVVVKDADLLGDGVNVAARLESLAEPGGICIASSVYDQITGKLDLGFQDIGEQALKNITRPVRVYRVSGARPLEPAVAVAGAQAAATGVRPLVWALGGAGVAVAAVLGVMALQGRVQTGTAPAAAPTVAAPTALSVATPAAAMPAPATSAAALAPTAPAAKTVASATAAAPKLALVAPPASKKTSAAAEGAAKQLAAASVPVVSLPPNPPSPATPQPVAQPGTLPVSQTAPRPSTAVNHVFDGEWSVRVDCPRHEEGAMGYTLELVAQVQDGLLRGEVGTADQPGWMLLRGQIQADGRAQLHAQGLTANPKYAVKGVRSGSPYQYDVEASFAGNQGQGRRLQLRACQLAFKRM